MTNDAANDPIFVCDICGFEDHTWKKFYNEYLKLFEKEEAWTQDKNKMCCILGYFCNAYLKHYSVAYVFVMSNPNPFGCKECRDVWKLLAVFNNDAIMVKKYIDWIFTKWIKNSTEITSFGYLLSPGIIRKYNLISSKDKNISIRYTNLPDTFISWCKANAPDIFAKYSLQTFNDLQALVNFAKFCSTGSTNNTINIERRVIDYAKNTGLIKEEREEKHG